MTETSPREVLGLLIKSGDFETAKSWFTLEKLDNDIKLVCSTILLNTFIKLDIVLNFEKCGNCLLAF
jgi:hypothetical protein